MTYMNARRRFGYFAIKNGYITQNQFIEAMRIQISSDQKGDEPALIGEILEKMDLMTDKQVEEVMTYCLDFEMYKCPYCGVLLHECPNCGANLMKSLI
jgi:rubrerythrin